MKAGIVAAVGIILLQILIVVYLVVNGFNDSYCLSRGFAESKVSITFQRYCIQRDYDDKMTAIPRSQIEEDYIGVGEY